MAPQSRGPGRPPPPPPLLPRRRWRRRRRQSAIAAFVAAAALAAVVAPGVLAQSGPSPGATAASTQLVDVPPAVDPEQLERDRIEKTPKFFCPSFDTFFTPGVRERDMAACTTTTVTRTTTTATETTTVGPPPTTTSTQVHECRGLCDVNSQPWFIKCGWNVCSTCGPCANMEPPRPPTTTVERNFSFFSTSTSSITSTGTSSTSVTSTSTTHTGSTVSGGSDGGDTSVGSGGGTVTTTSPVYTTLDFNVQVTTTPGTATVAAYACVPGCMTSPLAWSELCTWATCWTCTECLPTTTTLTTTLTTTSTSVTETSSTLTSTSTVNDTVVLETSTSTSTLTETSVTSTVTTSTITQTSTTTTTTAMPCETISSVFPTDACRPDNYSAGEVCTAPSMAHPCVVPTNFSFYCPESNQYLREPILEKGDIALKCRVCGFFDAALNDTNPEPDVLSVTLSFGPNALEGTVDEAGILGYSVYFVDECSRKVGEPLAYVEAVTYMDQPCCQSDAYTVDIEAFFPDNTSAFALMVVPNTAVGELPVGLTTELIYDLREEETTTHGKAITGAAADRPRGLLRWPGLPWLGGTLALWLAVPVLADGAPT